MHQQRHLLMNDKGDTEEKQLHSKEFIGTEDVMTKY